MKYLAAALLFAHGVAHLVGMASLWGLSQQPAPTAPLVDAAPPWARASLGGVWLVLALAFAATAVLVALQGAAAWTWVMIVAAVSLVTCLVALPGAWVGAVLNVAILAVAAWVRSRS